MNSLIIVIAALFALFAALCGWLAFTRSKLMKQKEQSESRIIQLETRLAEQEQLRQQSEKRSGRAKDHPAKQPRLAETESSEVPALRKEVAKFRDEAQKLRAELRSKENELKEAREGVEKRLYVLQEENRRLLEIAKEQDKKISHRDNQEMEQQTSLRSEIDRLRDELATERKRASESERHASRSSETTKNLQEKIASLQSENQKWREATAENNGKPLDPAQFFRWQRRALAGRDMYQMMKQLRELSDHKLQVYQSGVERLAAFVLASQGKPLPIPAQGEVLADRMLGEALGALCELSNSATTEPSKAHHDAEIAHSES